VLFHFPWELTMKKIFIATIAILAVSTSGAFAAKHHKMMKPKAEAAAAPAPMMMGNDTAANMKMMKKNKHDAGMK
jgi:hypothetical protein